MACHQIELKFEVVFVDDKILEVNFDRKDLARVLGVRTTRDHR
jgi:hypothetical protein